MAEVPELSALSARPPRWLKVALVVSLALNLGMAGLLAGSAFRHRDSGIPDAALAPVGLRLFGAALPDEAREGLRRDLGSRRGDMTEARRVLRAQVGALLAALRAEPFVPEDAARALAAQREIAGAQIALGQKALLARVAAMSATERRRFADRIEDEMRDAGRRRGRDRD